MEATFTFKQIALSDRRSGMKIGTDGVLLGAWASCPPPGSHIVDAGAGCGLISLMMAQRTQGQCTVTAVELNDQAVLDALDNVVASPWCHAIDVWNGNYLDYNVRADMVVSNPPFFEARNLQSPLQGRCEARAEATLTLKELMDHSDQILDPDHGTLAIILPSSRDEDCVYEGTLAHLYPRMCCHVTAVEGHSPKRTLWLLSRLDGPIQYQSLTLRRTDSTLTDEYRRLTQDFYL